MNHYIDNLFQNHSLQSESEISEISPIKLKKSKQHKHISNLLAISGGGLGDELKLDKSNTNNKPTGCCPPIIYCSKNIIKKNTNKGFATLPGSISINNIILTRKNDKPFISI